MSNYGYGPQPHTTDFAGALEEIRAQPQPQVEPTWARTARILREKAEGASAKCMQAEGQDNFDEYFRQADRAAVYHDAADIVEREGRAEG